MSLQPKKAASRRRETFGNRGRTSCVAVLALAVAAVTILATPAEGARKSETNEAATAELTIMGHVFRVPKAYLTQADDKAGRVIDSSSDGIFMRGILPDLRAPVGREVKYYAGGKPLYEAVDFRIWASPGYAGPDEHYFKQETLRICTGPENGYLICPHKRSYLPDQEVLVRVDGPRRLAFDCDKEGSFPNDLCRIILPLFDNIDLRLSFSREKFNSADAIIARVYELVCLFYRPEAGRKSTVNHCSQ